MKQIRIIILKIILFFIAALFFLATLGGIIICTAAANTLTLVLCIIFTILLFLIGTLLFYVALKKVIFPRSENQNIYLDNDFQPSTLVSTDTPATTSTNTEAKNDMIVESSKQYIEGGNTIIHADGSQIADEEIPYLMQLGYEESLQQTGQYNGEVLDTSFVVQSLVEKKNATIIPTYQEIINFPTNCPSNILSTDIFFLKYINGRSVENANIAQYWYYEYGLNYANELKKLYSSDMLRISNVNISKLKVVDLKNILCHFNLPLSGKKADLMNRILDNISSEDLSSFLGDSIHYFCATNKGISLIDSLNDSATFNLELENEAISLILDYDYEDAFNLIWDYKKQTPTEKNTHYEYSSNMDETYDSIMNPCGFFYTLEKDRDIEKKIRAAIVFCRMYGLGQDKIRKLVMRIYKENDHIFSEDAKNLINGRLL